MTAAALPGARVALADATLRPLRLLVGAAPGSVMDMAARQVGESLTAGTGQAVLVDNRPSAGGTQALELLRQAPAGRRPDRGPGANGANDRGVQPLSRPAPRHRARLCASGCPVQRPAGARITTEE